MKPKNEEQFLELLNKTLGAVNKANLSATLALAISFISLVACIACLLN